MRDVPAWDLKFTVTYPLVGDRETCLLEVQPYLIEFVMHIGELLRRGHNAGQEVKHRPVALHRLAEIANASLRRAAGFSYLDESQSRFDIRAEKTDAGTVRLIH